MVFYSALKCFEECKRKASNNALLPHFILSQIEHDSIKLIADYYRKENLAGKLSLRKLFALDCKIIYN